MVGLCHREGMSTRLVSVIFCRGKWGSDKVGRFVIISDDPSRPSSLLEAFFGRWREMPTELDQRNDGEETKASLRFHFISRQSGTNQFLSSEKRPSKLSAISFPIVNGQLFLFGFLLACRIEAWLALLQSYIKGQDRDYSIRVTYLIVGSAAGYHRGRFGSIQHFSLLQRA